MRGQHLPPPPSDFSHLPLSFELGETPKLIEQPWCDPTSPGVPDPALGTSGCASGCLPGTWCNLSRNRRGIGTILLPWPRGGRHRRCPLDVPKPCPSVRHHPGTAVGCLPNSWWGWCRAPEGHPGCPAAGQGCEVPGYAVVRGHSQLPSPAQPQPPSSLPGCKAQPSHSPAVFGEHSPTAGSSSSECPGWVCVSGIS